MKIKLLLLILIATILTILIFKNNYKYNINITSINSLSKEEDYNPLLIEKINSKLNNAFINIDFSNEDMEIENLISLIEHNTNNIQNVIHYSKVLIISIGNIDFNEEKLKTILTEYKKLFQLLRKYNNYQIIFISPNNIKCHEELKNLSNNYQIIYINKSSFSNNQLLVNNILKKITYIKS